MEAMQDTSQMTYTVAHATGDSIKGTFNSLDLQTVTLPDYINVEAIM